MTSVVARSRPNRSLPEHASLRVRGPTEGESKPPVRPRGRDGGEMPAEGACRKTSRGTTLFPWSRTDRPHLPRGFASNYSDHMLTNEELLSSLGHPQLEWNVPLSAAHADRLLNLLQPVAGGRIVDYGCGWGGLLLRALQKNPRATGIGVDQNTLHLARARRAARRLGVSSRVRFTRGDITEYRVAGDRVLCVGADHAWGGAPLALTELRSRVRPHGTLLFGSGYWVTRPSARLVRVFGNLPSTVDALRGIASSVGWNVDAAEPATLEEWDQFEVNWRQELEEVSTLEPGSPRGRLATHLVSSRREEYERGYRGVLGFVYLVLEGK